MRRSIESNRQPPEPTIRRHAHESADDSEVAHCCFCGSGKIYGRSDNTVVCEYCGKNFKVKVAPATPSMPQTDPRTGEPIEVRPQSEAPGNVPDIAQFEEQEEAIAQPLPHEEEPFTAAASVGYYLTAKGDALTEDEYIRSVAIAHADDRNAVLSQVREER